MNFGGGIYSQMCWMCRLRKFHRHFLKRDNCGSDVRFSTQTSSIIFLTGDKFQWRIEVCIVLNILNRVQSIFISFPYDFSKVNVQVLRKFIVFPSIATPVFHLQS